MDSIALLLDHFEEIIKLSVKTGMGISPNIGSKYAEVWVADKLRQFEPQLGKLREKTSADIYLKKIEKGVEVKYSTLKNGRWGWAFGEGTQFLKDKFDFCVLVAARKDGIPEKSFVIPLNAFKDDNMVKRTGVYPMNRKREKFAIVISEEPKDYERWKDEVGESPLEEILNKNPRKFEDRWNLIR